MNLKDELRELNKKHFVKYSEMARMVNLQPVSMYQYMNGNNVIAKGKEQRLADLVQKYKLGV